MTFRRFTSCAKAFSRAWIGGRCPWLGLGWDYVGLPRPEWAALVDGLADHAREVRRSGFTVLPKEIGLALAKCWKLKPPHPIGTPRRCRAPQRGARPDPRRSSPSTGGVTSSSSSSSRPTSSLSRSRGKRRSGSPLNLVAVPPKLAYRCLLWRRMAAHNGLLRCSVASS
jgi:hypothetical protein